jgi:hypothetical protein
MAMPFVKRKSGQAFLIFAGLIALAYSFYGWAELGRMTQTRAIDRELKAAADASHLQPPGIGQSEDLLARLERIQTANAPHEVRKALSQYVAALHAAIDATKAGRDLKPHDRTLEQTQKKLAATINDNWY